MKKEQKPQEKRDEKWEKPTVESFREDELKKKMAAKTQTLVGPTP